MIYNDQTKNKQHDQRETNHDLTCKYVYLLYSTRHC